jgi:hypothetical protein
MEKVRPEDTERMIQLLDRDGDRQVHLLLPYVEGLRRRNDMSGIHLRLQSFIPLCCRGLKW